MGLTFNLGRVSPSVFTDSSLNVGIGGSPSGSYKLEVTGTAKVSSTLLVSGAATFNTSVNITKSQTDNTNTLILSNSSTTGVVAAAGMSLQSYNGTSTVDVLTLSATGNSWSYQAYGANAGVVYAGGTGGLDLMAGNASGAIKFFTAGDGTGNQRMTISSAGNVGIGNSSPTAKLEITNGRVLLSNGYGYQFYNTAGTAVNTLQMYTDGNVYLDASDSTGGNLIFRTNSSNTERMRITSGGYIKQSNTGSYGSATSSSNEFNSNVADWTVVLRNTQASNPYGFYTEYVNTSPNNAANEFIYCRDSSAVRFRVASNGNAYNTTGVYTSGASDIRYKEQIVDANSQWNDIKSLRVVNFKFIKDVEENGDNALRHIGFIAQEVEKVSPNLIEEMTDKETGETWKTIKASIIHTKAIKALQEAMARIEILEERLNKAGL